jgi:hypothetical protein
MSRVKRRGFRIAATFVIDLCTIVISLRAYNDKKTRACVCCLAWAAGGGADRLYFLRQCGFTAGLSARHFGPMVCNAPVPLFPAHPA